MKANLETSRLPSLCKKYTNLTESDIQILLNLEGFLPNIGEAQGCDVFIDCKTQNPNKAIVAGEYRPQNSVYRNSVVGKYATRENEPAALRTLELGIPTRGLKGLTQENKAIIQNVSAIFNEAGEIIAVLIFERDETDVFNKEFLMSYNENFEEGNSLSKDVSITQYLDDSLVYFNNVGTVIYGNLQAHTLYKDMGYREDLIGMRFENIAFGKINFQEIITKEYIEIRQVTIASRIFKIKYHTIADAHSNLGVAMILRELTDIHNIERKLIMKTVDLKEIHHRVKNNLQTIASLLRLQARRLENSKEKRILEENIHRIISIALTHEILAQTGEDDVYIKDIVEKLITYLSQSSPSHSNIQISVEGDNILLKSDIATGISLVANELIQNSFKHAFRGTSEGSVSVYIQELTGDTAQITITDDGSGFDLSSESNKSLGLLIVRSMVEEKLRGSMDIASDENGTKVSIVFSTILQN